jgi:hypothetical protein
VNETIHNGDTAEYVGEHGPLVGKRCTVDSWSPKRKRVRVIIDVGGRAALRSVKPDNLKRLGGGVLESSNED